MAKTRICSIADCGNTHLARGYCRAHYLRWFRHGDPIAGGTMYGEPLKYYRETVLPYLGGDCLFWKYGKNTYGYPMLNIDGEQKYVSRLVCEEENGPPPSDNLDAAHSCGKGHLGCVARKHLRWATRGGNLSDKVMHGTSSRGERSNFAKLSEQNVQEIRGLIGSTTQKKIAAMYGVDQSTISDISRQKSWFWL